ERVEDRVDVERLREALEVPEELARVELPADNRVLEEVEDLVRLEAGRLLERGRDRALLLRGERDLAAVGLAAPAGGSARALRPRQVRLRPRLARRLGRALGRVVEARRRPRPDGIALLGLGLRLRGARVALFLGGGRLLRLCARLGLLRIGPRLVRLRALPRR